VTYSDHIEGLTRFFFGIVMPPVKPLWSGCSLFFKNTFEK
jgi:hypothetical protein